MYKLILLLLSLLMLSCSDDSDNFEGLKNTDTTPVEFDGESLITGTVVDTVLFQRDSLSFVKVEFPVKEGFSYRMSIDADSVYNIIYEDTMGSITVGGTDRTFEATVTGSKRIYFSIPENYWRESLQIHVVVREIKPTPSAFDGLWLLTKDENRSGEYEDNRYYSKSDASMVVEFENEVVNIYQYSTYSSEVLEYKNKLTSSYLFPKEYRIDDSVLVLFAGNDYGYTRMEFERIENIDDVRWKKENYVAPEQAQGLWYRSKVNENYMGNRVNSTEMLTAELRFTSPDLSDEIFKVEGDSVVRISRTLFKVGESTSSISDYIDLCENISTVGNESSDIEAFFDRNWDGSWQVNGIKTVYTKYEGEFPPASWYVITPDKPTVKLENGVTYKSETFSIPDTVWLEYEFEAGMTYSFTKESVDCSARAFLIDSDKAYVSELTKWYEAEKSGLHRIAVVVNVDEIEEESGSFEFTLFE